MMNLRLGSDFIDLAYRFDASEYSVSRTIYYIITILYSKKNVFKPNRQHSQKRLKNILDYKSVASLTVQKLKRNAQKPCCKCSVVVKLQKYSHDKVFNMDNSTHKVQLNSYPKLTLRDGVYNSASIEVPSFVFNKNQLHLLEIERTRNCSNVRIHIERVIEMVKQKCKILEILVPLSIVEKHSDEEVAYIDKITTVCCALCNICGSIVK